MKLKILILITILLVGFGDNYVLASGAALRQQQRKKMREKEERERRMNSENVFAEEDYQREKRRKLGTLPPDGCSTCPKCSASKQ